jgi:hypothetical protein
MYKIRFSLDVVILGLLVAGSLRAITMTTYSSNPFNINMNLNVSQYNSSPNIVGSTINNTNSPSSYTNYGTSVQNNNICITGFCGSSTSPTTLGVPTAIGNINILSNIHPQLTVFPIGTAVTVPGSVIPSTTMITVPGSVIPPSNISTVTTNIPTIKVAPNLNTTIPIGFALDVAADPEPSTVLLLVSGIAAFGILHRKTVKNRHRISLKLS